MSKLFDRVSEEYHGQRRWPAYAWPGGYPIYYVTVDGGVLCPKCANENLAETTNADPDTLDEQWAIQGNDVNWEDEDLICDNCNQKIESAYGGQ